MSAHDGLLQNDRCLRLSVEDKDQPRSAPKVNRKNFHNFKLRDEDGKVRLYCLAEKDIRNGVP